MSETAQMKQGEEMVNVSLEDIAGISLETVEETRFENAPAGIYHWKVIGGGLQTHEKDGNKKVYAAIELEVVRVVALIDESIQPEKKVGMKFTEKFWFTDFEKLMDDVGRVKAFLIDSGFTGAAELTLQAAIDAAIGHEFVAPIKQTKDKNNPEVVYANLDRGKVKPMAAIQ